MQKNIKNINKSFQNSSYSYKSLNKLNFLLKELEYFEFKLKIKKKEFQLNIYSFYIKNKL